jgi:two-component system NtrC family sensor kinase
VRVPRLSIVARVSIAVLAVVVAFAAALVDNVLVNQSLTTRLTRLSDVIMPVARQLDSVRRDLTSLSELAREDDPAVLLQALRAAVRVMPRSERAAEELRRLAEVAEQLAMDDMAPAHDGWWSNLGVTLETLQGQALEITGLLRALLDQLETDSAAVPETQARLQAALASFDLRLADVAAVVRTQADMEGSEIRQVQDNTQRRAILASSLATALALLMVMLVRASLRPVQRLTEAAARLRVGDYAPVPVPEGRDEVGVLAAEFVAMAQAVRDRDAQLRTKNEDLERALRALVDAQRARVEAERMAAVGELTSRITHELRNPLSSIGLNVEMLADELAELSGPTEEARAMVDSIDREVQRLMQLTTDFLSIARGVARHAVIDVVPVVRDVVGLMKPEFDQSSISVEVEGDVAQIFADANQLRQVFINLLRNAMAAVQGVAPPETGHRVRVRVEDSEHDVWIHVDDTGPGVPQELRTSIFEAFITTRPDGTGLGLSISRDIVVAHRGQLLLVSPGPLGGARFTIHLPAIDSDAEDSLNAV